MRIKPEPTKGRSYIYPVEPLLAADIGNSTTEEGRAENQEKV